MITDGSGHGYHAALRAAREADEGETALRVQIVVAGLVDNSEVTLLFGLGVRQHHVSVVSELSRHARGAACFGTPAGTPKRSAPQSERVVTISRRLVNLAQFKILAVFIPQTQRVLLFCAIMTHLKNRLIFIFRLPMTLFRTARAPHVSH